MADPFSQEPLQNLLREREREREIINWLIGLPKPPNKEPLSSSPKIEDELLPLDDDDPKLMGALSSTDLLLDMEANRSSVLIFAGEAADLAALACTQRRREGPTVRRRFWISGAVGEGIGAVERRAFCLLSPSPLFTALLKVLTG